MAAKLIPASLACRTRAQAMSRTCGEGVWGADPAVVASKAGLTAATVVDVSGSRLRGADGSCWALEALWAWLVVVTSKRVGSRRTDAAVETSEACREKQHSGRCKDQ